MINTVYRLVAPRRFEIAFEDIDLFGDNAIVRPTNLSICNADMRYYLGTRDAKVLAEKLPMALIHEGVGVVMRDPSGKFAPGDRVVMVPNCPTETDDYIGENLFTLLQVLRLVYGWLFAGVCGDFAPAAGEAAPGHQYECGGVYGDRVRSGARHFSV